MDARFEVGLTAVGIGIWMMFWLGGDGGGGAKETTSKSPRTTPEILGSHIYIDSKEESQEIIILGIGIYFYSITPPDICHHDTVDMISCPC